MGERALTASLSDTDVVARHSGRAEEQSHSDSPAIRLLDALREGDDYGVLAVCGETTTASAENMQWTCRGREEIHEMLIAARERFPGLTFESRTRHIGFGLVIDEARVQDVPLHGEDRENGDEGENGEGEEAASPAPAHLAEVPVDEDEAAPNPDVHPMWDEPATEKRNVLAVWRHRADELPPMRLNMPVRVTVRHDDLQVHDITLSFPAALLKRALGMHVDPLEMSLSEVQSAFIAPVGAGFTTYELARPELTLAPPAPPEPEPAVTEEEPPRRRRRRRRILVPVLLVLLALAAGAGWWEVQGQDQRNVAGATSAASTTPTPQPTPSAAASPSPSASSSVAPKVTQAPPSSAPSRKPNVTLKSDLAFGFNSAKLSAAAKREIDRVAKQVRSSALHGNIYVDGYTDDLGSAAYGKLLSQRRATAVSNYLKTQLIGVPVTIVSIGHGEADPIRSNATEAGRKANRRVTITLPRS